MIKEIVDKWDRNKPTIKCWFQTTRPESYEDIVRKLFELVINDGVGGGFNISDMTVIDNGEYRGSKIFIIPSDTYQPEVSDYLICDVCYGSCSMCDTLIGIRENSPINFFDEDDELQPTAPSDEQVSDYMTLALHIVQNLRWLSEKEE